MVNVTCKRCHRPLTNPKSIERGYGPVCAKKLGISIGGSKTFLSILAEEYRELNIPTLEEYFGDKNPNNTK